MKCIDSNEILEFIGNILSSMNSQVLSRKYNNKLYSSLFAEFMKEIDNEEENQCHNIFGLNNIFLQNGIIYNENNIYGKIMWVLFYVMCHVPGREYLFIKTIKMCHVSGMVYLFREKGYIFTFYVFYGII